MEELTPITRKETFLAKAAGQDVETPTPITREEVFLDAIAKAGGSSLPPVTPSDNGKVLGVVDGAWAAENNLFVVNFSTTPLITADKTYAEIVAAVAAGKQIIGIRGSGTYAFVCLSMDIVYFAGPMADGNVGYITVSSSGIYIKSYAQLPTAYTSTDNGKILKVANGKWSKVAQKFIVTLTPTGLDYSGMMDKTPGEIMAAYNAGQEIWFSMDNGAGSVFNVPCDQVIVTTDEYPNFCAKVLVSGLDSIVYVGTYSNTNAYWTTIYSLTPAS